MNYKKLNMVQKTNQLFKLPARLEELTQAAFNLLADAMNQLPNALTRGNTNPLATLHIPHPTVDTKLLYVTFREVTMTDIADSEPYLRHYPLDVEMDSCDDTLRREFADQIGRRFESHLAARFQGLGYDDYTIGFADRVHIWLHRLIDEQF
jgi:hypothetical protein